MVLEVLHPIGVAEDFSVDIVAIHGLNGDLTATWTNPKTKAFWLKDFLPQDVPGARIMTFGYNAAAAFGNSISDFEDHARDLLSSLVDKRQRDDEIQRPLIFIAHSLGGIIVKQALTSARVDPRHQSINEHTVGIAFFGTPHRGSQTAAYGSLLANIATFAMNKHKPSLVEALKQNSAELLKLTSDFRHELKKYEVVSFYERRPTGIGRVSAVIVDKYSALLESELEDQIPVDADHRDICRFAKRDDPTYEKLFHRLNRMSDTPSGSRPESLQDQQWMSFDSGWTPLHRAAHDGDPAELRRLLGQGSSVDLEDHFGMTPLHLAAAAGHDTITYILLKKHAQVELQDDSGRTALHCAAENGQVSVIRELLMHNVDVRMKKNRSSKTALDCALEKHHKAVIWLLKYGPDVTAKDENGDTMIFWAVANGQEDVVRMLARTQAIVTESRGEDGVTVLHSAAGRGNKVMARILIEYGAEINAQNNYGTTPLHFAVSNGHQSIVELLINKGADIAVTDSLGRSASDLTSESGNEAVVRLLKDAQRGHDNEYQSTTREEQMSFSSQGFSRASTLTAQSVRGSRDEDISRATNLSRTSTIGATSYSDKRRTGKETLPLPRVHRTDSKNERAGREGSNELFKAVETGNYELMEKLAHTRRADIKAKDKTGATLLHIASQKGYEEIVSLLVELGADINATDKLGTTALHMSSQGGHEEIVLLLLEEGADFRAKTTKGQTALHMASQNGHESTVKRLFDKGASLDSQDMNGMTALASAALHGNDQVVQFLLANKADIGTIGNGETALHMAASRGYEKVAQLLLENGIDIDKQNNLEFTALHIASGKGNKDVVQLLLENGADLEKKTKVGFTALHLAANSGHEAVTRLLIQHKAMIEVPCRELGAMPLHYAAMSKVEAVVRVLIDSGAVLESRCDQMGATALHYAAMTGVEGTVRLLLDRGADVRAENKSGNMASYWAKRYEHNKVVELLKMKEKEAKEKAKERAKEKAKEEKEKEKAKEREAKAKNGDETEKKKGVRRHIFF